MNRRVWTQVILVCALFIVLVVNSMLLERALIGILVSIAILYVASEFVGGTCFSSEKHFLRVALGFATLVILLALGGSALTLVARYTELWSLALVVILTVLFYLPHLRKRKPQTQNQRKGMGLSKIWKWGGGVSASAHVIVYVFLASVGLSFYALWIGRTGEGLTSVWLTVPSFFLPAFLLASLSLVLVLFSTRVSIGLKLSLLSIFSLLAHSLFIIVWYPGRYGDPWLHLGEVRVIDATGTPYAYERLLSRFALLDLLGAKAQYSLIVLFRRMFCVDIYWVHIAFIPVLWSIFMPLFSYKIAEFLTSGRNTTIPLLAAVSTLLFPTLIIWGTVSVPNSLAFVFFLFTILLILYWMNDGKKRLWFTALLTSLAAILAHPQAGIFALLFLLLATVFQKVSNRPLKVGFYIASLFSYPLALYFYGATFSVGRFFSVDNFLSFQSVVITLPFVLGAVGLIVLLLTKRTRARNTMVLCVFYITVLLEYYVTMYGMKNTPFGPGRALVLAELLLVPLMAFGLWSILYLLKRAFASVKISFPMKIKSNPRGSLIASALICVFLASQATLTLYQSYPRKEIVDVQPAAYEVEAIRYIDSTAPGRYVVLAGSQFAGLAVGILGADYAYGANPKGIVGLPELWFRTVKAFLAMCTRPSISILKEAMQFDRASVAYFVVSIRDYDFLGVVQRVSELLPVHKVFGEGKLYMFLYPLPIVEGTGPNVKVVFEDGSSRDVETKLSYMFESEANFTLTISGRSSYNVTGYPLYWTFHDLKVNNGSKQAWFDESSDVNSFIHVKDLLPEDTLTIVWQANLNYPNALWKDESFRTGWHTHRLYPGTIQPQISTDGNVLNMMWSFTPGKYQYYYYVKDCNISFNASSYVILRWKSTGPIAVVVAYVNFAGQTIVPFGSQSSEWSRTILRLPPGNIDSIMIGISNLKNTQTSGSMTVFVDYILLVSGESGD